MYAATEGKDTNWWRSIHQDRLLRFLRWQTECVKDCIGSPWMALKLAKPRQPPWRQDEPRARSQHIDGFHTDGLGRGDGTSCSRTQERPWLDPCIGDGALVAEMAELGVERDRILALDIADMEMLEPMTNWHVPRGGSISSSGLKSRAIAWTT